jgi:cardiolipin synthase
LLQRGLRRAAEAPLLAGNSARLLVDAPGAYPEMLRLIAGAKHRVHLENYIIRADNTGRMFADALSERARAGVEVRVLYDWLGSRDTPTSFWKELRAAGCEVRPFGSPALVHPLALLRRDHRKLLVVDARSGVVGGLCIGDEWMDDRNQGCWRDTAVRVDGPAARELDVGFARMWRRAGGTVTALAPEDSTAPGDNVTARVIDGLPLHGRVYRLYQLLAAVAERNLYVTGAYPLAPRSLRAAFAAAARAGVDVRLLVAGRSDLPWLNQAGRLHYESLLRAGVRIYEWTGPMLHAKTLVTDGVLALVGSSNLNAFSFQGCYELDLEIQDPRLACEFERLFLADLARAREVTLGEWRKRSRRQRLQQRTAAALLWLPFKLYSA